MDITLSDLDEMRFGCRTAKAAHVTVETLPDALAFCRRQHVQLLIARCSAADVRTAQAMERAECLLMDTLVYYARKLEAAAPADGDRVPIRLMQAGEEDAIVVVAADAFRGYTFSHYHADARLNPADCDAVYTSWTRALCLARSETSDVLVAGADGEVLGFATLRLNTPQEGEGVLFGVAPAAQGLGIYRSFMLHGMEWCQAKSAARMVVSTQIGNLPVQRVWARLGFVPDSAYYTFHKWFDER